MVPGGGIPGHEKERSDANEKAVFSYSGPFGRSMCDTIFSGLVRGILFIPLPGLMGNRGRIIED